MANVAYNWLSDITEFLNDNADPRTKNWAFMNSPVPIVTACICYLYFVCIAGPRYMRNRKPYDLTKVITVYNVFQIFACVTLIYGMLSTYPITRFGCELGNLADTSTSYKIAGWTWWTTLLKLTELLETVFFVLRKKQNQISALHLYHHVSTLSLSWVITKFIPGEPTVIPIVLNSFIHILMYSYYLVALYGGKKIQKKIIIWKQTLTLLQMVQFTIIIAHLLRSLGSQCGGYRPLFCILLLNMFINYFMFYKFYKVTYKKKVE